MRPDEQRTATEALRSLRRMMTMAAEIIKRGVSPRGFECTIVQDVTDPVEFGRSGSRTAEKAI